MMIMVINARNVTGRIKSEITKREMKRLMITIMDGNVGKIMINTLRIMATTKMVR